MANDPYSQNRTKMNALTVTIVLLVVVPLIVVGVWQFLQLALVHINTGTVGLLIVRGKATDRVLTPGVHFVWPFRQTGIQGYSVRDLTYLTSQGAADETDFADPPLRASFADRTPVAVNYTIRFRIKPESLLTIHTRFGPDGIKPLVRDVSRSVIIDELAAEGRTADDAFGAGFGALAGALADRLTAELAEAGFEVSMFSLRDLDLGPVGDIITRTASARLELELERVAAQVRRLRAEHETETATLLSPHLTDDLLRYRRIELLREALQRWDGRVVVTDTALTQPAVREAEGAP